MLAEVDLRRVLVDQVIGGYIFVRDECSSGPLLPIYANADAFPRTTIDVYGIMWSAGGRRVVLAGSIVQDLDPKGNPFWAWPTPDGSEWPWTQEVSPGAGAMDEGPPPPPEAEPPEEYEPPVADAGTIAYAKLHVGSTVPLADKVVTAVFHQDSTCGPPSFFYIQEPKGSSENVCGIRVDWQGCAVEVGDCVTVSGTVVGSVPNGPVIAECHIDASSVDVDGQLPVPEPVGLIGRSTAGGVFGGQSMLSADTTSDPVKDGYGLSAVGLLVRVWGRSTDDMAEGHVYYVDDGSGLKRESHTGLKVDYWGDVDNPLCDEGWAQDDYVEATGILGAELSLDEASTPVPVLRIACASPQSASGVIYVSDSAGHDEHDGLSWCTAVKTVEHGIDLAASHSPPYEVWVAAGTYNECITLADGVAVYGGFAGTECSRDERNWSTNVTVLDAEGLDDTVVTAGSGVSSSARIDGFTITHGLSAGLAGGITCTGGSPAIGNNTIKSNVGYYGGGVYVSSASPQIEHNTITGNSAGAEGGGIFVDAGSPEIADNDISSNTAGDGGGIFAAGGSPVIANNDVTTNACGDEGGGMYFDGGSPEIDHNTIDGNSAWLEGGGIFCIHSAPVIDGNAIKNNIADPDEIAHGGGISFEDHCNATVVNNLFCANQATGNVGGGAINVYSDPSGSWTYASIVNNTFVGNTAVNGYGGAVLVRTGPVGAHAGSHADVVNNIFDGNKAKNFEDPDSVGHSVRCLYGATASVSYCDAFSTYSLDPPYHYFDLGSQPQDCLYTNPLFCGSGAFPYSLQANPQPSPLRSAGDSSSAPDHDIGERGRPGTVAGVDIGAYENDTLTCD